MLKDICELGIISSPLLILFPTKISREIVRCNFYPEIYFVIVPSIDVEAAAFPWYFCRIVLTWTIAFTSIPIFRWYKTTRSEKTSTFPLLSFHAIFLPFCRGISTAKVIRFAWCANTHHHRIRGTRGAENKRNKPRRVGARGIEWIFIVVALPRIHRGSQ